MTRYLAFLFWKCPDLVCNDVSCVGKQLALRFRVEALCGLKQACGTRKDQKEKLNQQTTPIREDKGAGMVRFRAENAKSQAQFYDGSAILLLSTLGRGGGSWHSVFAELGAIWKSQLGRRLSCSAALQKQTVTALLYWDLKYQEGWGLDMQEWIQSSLLG